MPRTPTQRPIACRDRQRRVWYVSEVARFKVVSPAIDGPNVALVIRFEREGEERFARWVGGDEWRRRDVLHRLFAEAESVASGTPVAAPQPEATAPSVVLAPAAPNDSDSRDAADRMLAPWEYEPQKAVSSPSRPPATAGCTSSSSTASAWACWSRAAARGVR
jgi:CelD/BcsL family acetyltransferase involved in cellulose biosynthesis